MQEQIPPADGTDWLAAVEILSGLLVNDRGLEEKLQSAADFFVFHLQAADAAIIWLHDPSSSRLCVSAASGLDRNMVKNIRINDSEGLAGRFFHSGKSEIYEPQGGVSSPAGVGIIPGRDVLWPDPASAVFGLPLISGKVKHGVLMLPGIKSGAEFSRSRAAFFGTAANLIALAVDNAACRDALGIKEALIGDSPYGLEVISTVAHEMRTPLTSIKGYSTALLLEEAHFDSATQREFLEIIDQECDVLENLISNFLESSTIDAGTLKIEIQPVRLPRLAQTAAEEIKHRFPGHTVLVDFGPDFPLVDADPERILQVIRQLLDNAAKYSPENSLIVVRGRIVDRQVVISVADEGVGITPEDLNRLFERFFRAKSKSGTKVIGTGLGLPISRAIVEAHDGHIWAESQLGQGSVFSFSLPLKGPSQDPSG